LCVNVHSIHDPVVQHVIFLCLCIILLLCYASLVFVFSAYICINVYTLIMSWYVF